MAKAKRNTEIGDSFHNCRGDNATVIKILDDKFCLVEFESGWKQVILRLNVRDKYNALDGFKDEVKQWQIDLNERFNIKNYVD